MNYAAMSERDLIICAQEAVAEYASSRLEV